jgi:hypothetical protein
MLSTIALILAVAYLPSSHLRLPLSIARDGRLAGRRAPVLGRGPERDRLTTAALLLVATRTRFSGS